jgi:isopenicillin-N N-acyltransferase-like protein
MTGNAFERGLVHGRTLARAIKANMTLYHRMVRGMTGLRENDMLGRAGAYLPFLRETVPELVEEMEGIAKGADTPLNAVLFLNARTEIMSTEPGTPECTSLGLTGERTVNGKPVMAQNWDWHSMVGDGTALFHVSPKEGPRCLYLAEAGQVGKIGLNENGVGVLLNILFSEPPQIGVPVHVLLRQVLGLGSVPEAISLVERSRRASSSHFLLGDIKGNLVGLELSPGAVAHVRPSEGAVVHTNHYCDAGLSTKDRGPAAFPDTIPRLARIRAFMADRKRWGLEDLKEILTDHEDGPSSICRHVDDRLPEHMHMESVASLILDLPERKMMVSRGQPCRNAYTEVVL